MTDRTLITNPLWQANTLGQAIPNSRHGISVALPHWQHVIGYEERNPAVCDHINGGYPRFIVHPDVAALVKSQTDEPYALPFPSEKMADAAIQFTKEQSGEEARLLKMIGATIVITSEPGFDALKKFWQHTGMIISSRQAQTLTSGKREESNGKIARQKIRETLATWYHCSADDVFLHPTGMGSLYMALRAIMANRPNTPSIQLGFPYVDTLKLQEKLGAGAIFISKEGGAGVEEVKQTLATKEVSALFCEVPTNPMLMTPDLQALYPLLKEKSVPLIVDDTIATPFNVNVTPYADLIMTSLTKHLTGTGTVMGGALICNPSSPLYSTLKKIVGNDHEELLGDADAIEIEPLLHDFPERMKHHNHNGRFIAEKLRAHPAIERVWYPAWDCRDAYDAVRTPEGGYSSLITFLTKDHEKTAAPIYDALPVSKGPSLGTNFTLASPFTLLAHYHELDWAAQHGVLPTMIRISIGMEEPEELWDRFNQVLEKFK